MTESIVYRAPRSEDEGALRAMARRCWDETFGDDYEDTPLGEFLDREYGPGGAMASDLADSRVRWMVAFDPTAGPIGYIKLTPLRVPAVAPRADAAEVRQLYVLAPWHGSGVAARLMAWALGAARETGSTEVYLAVWGLNERAKRFYERHGFLDTGETTAFRLGERVDYDNILRLDLATAPDSAAG